MKVPCVLCPPTPAFATHPQISRVRPSKRSLFPCPRPHPRRVTRVYRYQCPGQIRFLPNNCLVFLTFEIRRTVGFLYIKTLKELSGFKEEPEVNSLIQIVFVDHGLYIQKGFLIFLRIVIMNLINCHDIRQGFVQFIVPAPQWSTSLVSHRSPQDSTRTSSAYLPRNLVGRPTFKIRKYPKLQ